MSALSSDSATLPMPPPPMADDEVTIRVDGVFDGATAWELRHTLENSAHGGRTVVLDFSRVREFYDFGVSVLAYSLAQRSRSLPRVLLRGLRTHQHRMLRYFGVETEG